LQEKKREYSRYIKNAKNYISELQQDKKAVNRNHRIQKEEQRLKDLEYALKYLKEVEKERKAEVNRHNNNQRYRR